MLFKGLEPKVTQQQMQVQHRGRDMVKMQSGRGKEHFGEAGEREEHHSHGKGEKESKAWPWPWHPSQPTILVQCTMTNTLQDIRVILLIAKF